MVNIPTKPSYDHGTTGTAPSSPLDYGNGDTVDADEFDYFIATPLTKIDAIIDFLNAIDSNEDGKVDAADVADTANNATKYKGNDIDTDGDGKVDAAVTADTANTASAYKQNDIDSDGDGVVNAADKVETGGSAAVIRDTTNAQDLLVANEGGPVNVPVALQQGGSNVLTTADEGSGNGLDADTVDGKDASQLGTDFPLTFPDNDGDTNQFSMTEDGATGDLEVRHGGTARHELAQNGDLRIEGELTETAAL